MTDLLLFPEGGSIDAANSATKLVDIALHGGSFPAANGDFPSGVWAGMDRGDTLVLWSRAETAPGSKTPTGGLVPWTVGDTKVNNDVYVGRNGTVYGSTFNGMNFDDFIGPPGVTEKQIIKCNTGVNIKGVTDGGVKTRFTAGNPINRNDSGGVTADWAPFYVFGDYMTLEHIDFYQRGAYGCSVVAIHPCHLKELKMHDCHRPNSIAYWMDNRSVYGLDKLSSGDYSDLLRLIVEDLQFEDTRTGVLFESCSGLEFKNSTIDFTAGSNIAHWNMGVFPVEEDLIQLFWGNVISTFVRDTLVHGNDITFAPSTAQTFQGVNPGIRISDSLGGEFRNNKFYDNSFKAGSVNAGIWGLFMRAGDADPYKALHWGMSDNYFYNNTFEDFDYPMALFADNGFSMRNTHVFGNTFVRNSGSRVDAEVIVEAQISKGSSVAGLVLSGNDYSAAGGTGIVGTGDVKNGAIILGEGTYGCKVSEKDFAATDSDGNNVTNWGVNNEILGKSATIEELPFGRKAAYRNLFGL